MKTKTIFISIIILLLTAISAFASGMDITSSPTAQTADTGKILNLTFNITNTGSDSIYVTNVLFQDFSDDKYTFESSAFTVTPLNIEILAGKNQEFNFTISTANNPFADTYNGVVNITAVNSTGGTLTKSFSLPLTINPASNATLTVTNPTGVSGQKTKVTATIQNTGNTELQVDKFGEVLLKSGSTLIAVAKYTPVTVAYGQANQTDVELDIQQNVPAGNYIFNLTAEDTTHGVSLQKTYVLTVQAANEQAAISSTQGSVKVKGTTIESQTPTKATITNTGNVPLQVTLPANAILKNGNKSIVLATTDNAFTLNASESRTVNYTTTNAEKGSYTGTITARYGSNDTEENLTLTTVVSDAKVSLSTPTLLLVPSGKQNPGTSGSNTLTITNNGDVELKNLFVSSTADSKYNIKFSTTSVTDQPALTIGSLKPSESITLTVNADIPSDENAGVHTIGEIKVSNSDVNRTTALRLNVAPKLFIKEVNVKIRGGSNRVNSDGGQVDDSDAKPGASFGVIVTVCNGFKDGDTKIENINLEAKWENVDDGGDIWGDVNEFSIRANSGNDKCVDKTINFDSNNIPLVVDSTTYNLVVDVNGDANSTNQQDSWTIPVKVRKDDKTKILLDKVSLSPETIECGQTTVLDIRAVNIGDSSDDHSVLKIINRALGMDVEKKFDIGTNPDDDCDAVDNPDDGCIGVDHSFELRIPNDAKKGTYNLDVIAYHDRTREDDKKTATLVVGSCNQDTSTSEASSTKTTSKSTSSENGNSGIEILRTASGTLGLAGTSEFEATGNARQSIARVVDLTEKKDDTTVVLLIAANILVVVLLLAGLAALFKK